MPEQGEGIVQTTNVGRRRRKPQMARKSVGPQGLWGFNSPRPHQKSPGEVDFLRITTRLVQHAFRLLRRHSPDNRSRQEINECIHRELQPNGRVDTQEHTFTVLVPRQEITGADRQWAGHVIHVFEIAAKAPTRQHLFGQPARGQKHTHGLTWPKELCQ